MEAGGDDLFVINDVEADEREEVRDSRPVEQAQETEAEVMESVKGLVPLCAQHAQGPQLSSATFGYDIALMAKRPWAEPGAKLSDYFNYGFNEQSWRVYCAMQEKGEESLLANATAMLQKLELAARPGAGAAAEEAGAGGHVARGEPPMMMVGGIMDGYSDGGPYGGGHGMYGGQEGPGRGGGYGRPYQPREFHPHGGGGFERLQNANYKTRLCKGFAEGHCNRGNQCNFAHGVGELRQPGGGEPIPPPPPQQQQQHMPQQLPPAGLAAGGSAPPPMAQVYGDHRSGFNNYYTPPPPQVMTGGAPPQAPERVNYLMPSFQGGASMPPMMGGPAMPMQDSSDGAGSGFRQPPKRPRQDGGGVYEPQY